MTIIQHRRVGVVFAAMAAALLFSACEKVVELDLAEGEKQLVVEARLERVLGNVTGAQRVQLTTTSAYFSNASPPPARGAVVRVSDNAGNTVTFAESPSEPGVYVTNNLVVQAGRAYTLQIEYDGSRYESTEVAQAVAPIDTLYFAERTGFFGPEEGNRAAINFRDPANRKDFYLWDQYVNGVRLLSPDTSFKFRVAAQDIGLDGRLVENFQPYDGVVIKPGDQVLVRQMALTERIFQFYFALSDQAANDGSPFSVPLASVRGNVANVTTPRKRALGYFFATEVSEARRTAN